MNRKLPSSQSNEMDVGKDNGAESALPVCSYICSVWEDKYHDTGA